MRKPIPNSSKLSWSNWGKVSIAIGTLTIESSDSAEKKENSPIKGKTDNH